MVKSRASSSSAELRAFRELAELLAPGVRAVAERVALAVEDPAAYVKKHARELGERGVTKPIPRLPLVALLDGLAKAKRAALVDWKAPAEDVRHALRGLSPRVAFDWAWTKAFDEDALDDLATERVLAAVAASAPPATALVNLDTSSDQYALAVVDAARGKKIVATMKAAGHRAAVIAPEPVAAPKRSPTPAKAGKAGKAGKVGKGGAPMTDWPDCAADPPGTWRNFIHRETQRALYVVKYESALRLLSGPAWSTDTKDERREFASPARCAAAYAALYAELHRDGWLQLSQEEQAKEIRANAAARKRR